MPWPYKGEKKKEVYERPTPPSLPQTVFIHFGGEGYFLI